jgi:hypothetical protein
MAVLMCHIVIQCLYTANTLYNNYKYIYTYVLYISYHLSKQKITQIVNGKSLQELHIQHC